MNLEGNQKPQTGEDNSAGGPRRTHLLRFVLLLVILPMFLTGLTVHFALNRPHADTVPLHPEPEFPTSSQDGKPPVETPAPPSILTVLVLGAEDEPLPGVEVEAVGAPLTQSSRTIVSGTSDKLGRLELRLQEGRYLLRAFSQTHFGLPREFEVPHERELNLRLTPGVHLMLLVIDEEERPLPGAHVSETWLGLERTVVTDEDGLADLGAQHPQWSRVRIEKEGYLPRTEWMELLGRFHPAHQAKMMLKTGGLLVVSTVEHESGLPIPGTRVRISHSSGGMMRDTGEDGTARFPGCLIPGEVSIFSNAVDGRGVSERIQVVPGEIERRVALLYPPGRTIGGVVVRAGDQSPVKSAQVFLDNSWAEAEERAVTDAHGLFQFGPAPGDSAATVRLKIHAPGLAMREEDYGSIEPGPERSDRLRIELVPTGSVTVTVMDRNGEPATDADVSIRLPGGESPHVLGDIAVDSASGGRYRFVGVPPREELLIVAEQEGLGVGWSESVTLLPGGDLTVPEITLSGVRSFTGKVVDTDGVAVPLAWLWLHSRVKTEGTRASWRVVVDGEFPEITEVPDTGSVAEVGAPGFFQSSHRAKEGENVIVLHRILRISGQAIDAETGTPILNGLLDLSLDSEQFFMRGRSEQAVTAAEGRFVAREVRRGFHDVRVRGTKLRARVEVTHDGQDLGQVRFEVR